ncbi:MAG: outer membrane beta-barrel protein [Nitrospirae bacterium]|nr:outer membrane beta-barrel protein [Nitrospirota bacterium]
MLRMKRDVATWSLVVLFGLITDLHAEVFLGAYGGWTRGQGTDVAASSQSCFTVTCQPASYATRSVTFQSGGSVGLRAGYWFERLPMVGLAGDLSFYRTSGSGFELDAVPLSALVFFRVPFLATEQQRGGRLQPYVGIGPSLVVQTASADFRPALPAPVTGWAIAPGWDARAGLSMPLSSRVSLFSEWRLTQQRVDIRNTPLFNLGMNERISATLTTHHYLFGVSWHF